MRESLVMFRRELKSYFLSPIAYVVGVLFLIVQMGFAGFFCLIDRAQARMDGFFTLLPFVLVLFLPGLTMRLWAEERKVGTLELLMTFPVRIGALVVGKFLAVMAFLAVVLLFTLVLPMMLTVYGSLDWSPVIGGYLASLLMAGAFVAVGMVWSSVTRDQIVAMLLALVSLALLLGIGVTWFLDLIGITRGVPDLVDWLGMPRTIGIAALDVCAAISPYRYFESVARGVIDTRDLVYYACFCGFFLWLNALALQSRRQKG